jgi:hypothetical protein
MSMFADTLKNNSIVYSWLLCRHVSQRWLNLEKYFQFGPTYPQKQMCKITTTKLFNHFKFLRIGPNQMLLKIKPPLWQSCWGSTYTENTKE